MRNALIILGITIILAGVFGSFAIGEDETETASDKAISQSIKFIGYKGCICHNKVQIKVWKQSKHAKAFDTLGSEAAKKIGQEMGLETEPQHAPECLKCHVTAYGVDKSLLTRKFDIEDGVQCESCHGPGDMYKAKSVMESISQETGEKKKKVAKLFGLIVPDEATCKTCHNEESPTFKGFDYDHMFQIIAHNNPEE